MANANNVRVRFCPSPTGNPHVGLVRTALFNWAFARHNEGTLVFRIEDTDAARDSEESYDQLLDSLRWLGLNWDEGPDEVGGPHAPYRQSQRMDIYQDVAEKLLAGGYAYHCYCTTPELDERRDAARKAGKSSGYDGHCRDLSAEQTEAYKAEGRTSIVRFRMPDETITFTDLVRGELTFTPENVPDYGIVRANGAPLYTLVNPVDDALMEITHVLRGEDLLSSTPRQVALYKALIELGIAQQIPAFGHLPYVMGEGNKKLSKRDPEASLNLYRERGFLPEGLLNYLSLLGWSFSKDQDVFTIDQLVEKFDIADVNANPARFDLKKAEAINADHIRMLDVKAFAEACAPWLRAP
ncbi:glutamate--tRNA ligase, partial [Streptomyces beijiangensis]